MSNSQELKYISVLLDTGIDRPLDYAIPEPFLGQVLPGMRVEVPVRGGYQNGTVFELKQTPDVPNVKPLTRLLSEKPEVPPELFSLAAWVSRYYCAPLRRVLRSILPPTVRRGDKLPLQLHVKAAVSRDALAAACEKIRQKNGRQAAVLDILLKHPAGILLSALLELAETSRSPVDSLVKQGLLSLLKLPTDRLLLAESDFFQTKHKKLSDEQARALQNILESVKNQTFSGHLLHGVTGSGKTEVYLQAIDETLKLGKGVILLVPEITLTAQTMERLRGRFQDKIAILHHRLSDTERLDAWHQIRDGKVKIVTGARSAIFSPVNNLGLIIVDEEHEPSYKQSDLSPCYHARDVAVMRAKLCGATVVLGSATPSLESYANGEKGKYRLSTLVERPTGASLPKARIIDMRDAFAKAKGFTLFSDELLNAIEKRLGIGEQTILFLNRRGYHTGRFCTLCLHKICCPSCDLPLTFHLGENILACHLCDHRIPSPRTCPSCHSSEGLKFKGAGTEQVERALHAIFPQVRTLRLDADTTRHKGSSDQLLKQFRSGKADVLIGTQMVSKGLHFPSVTLVGVLHADAGLQIPDFRAAEQTFQLITQVAGRAGRDALAGEVIIQTHLPDHPAILLAKEHNYTGFYAEEIALRKQFDFPPFTHLVKLTFSGENENVVKQTAEACRSTLIARLAGTFQILPVVPSGHAKVKGNYRFQFLIKGKNTAQVSATLTELPPPHRSVRMGIDIDPQHTYF
jgi:primosomal protein N' (replication factor Y)